MTENGETRIRVTENREMENGLIVTRIRVTENVELENGQMGGNWD